MQMTLKRMVLGTALTVCGCTGGLPIALPGQGGNANGLEGRYLAECTETRNGNYTPYSGGIAGISQPLNVTEEDQRDVPIEKGDEEGAVIEDKYCAVLLEQDGSEDLEMKKDTDCEQSTATTSRVGTSTAQSTARQNLTITWTSYKVKKGSKENTVKISAEGDFSLSSFQNDAQQYAYNGTIELDCEAERMSAE